MEHDAWQEKVASPYILLWHSEIREDFKQIHPSVVEKIIKAVQHRLSLAPHVIGEPLKGTSNLVWKIRFSDYRILYTMNRKAKEVWVLSVRHRSVVYQEAHVQDLVNWALALQKASEEG